MAEARAYMGSAVAKKAIDGTDIPTFSPVACESGASLEATTTTDLTFVPRVRGTATEKKSTICKPDSGSCKLED